MIYNMTLFDSRPSREPRRIFQNTTLENTERELRVFEALEERAEHSSFSSTNSSIIGILSSTPTRRNTRLQVGETIQEQNLLENDLEVENDTDIDQHRKSNKIQNNNRKQHLLHTFLSNLKHIVNQRDDESKSM